MRFSAVDLPEANDLTVGIMALVAQQEREAISSGTKEALSIARSRGVKLGNPNGAAALRRAGKGGGPLREAIARNANRHAKDLAPVIEDIRAGGATSLQALAAELNDRGMPTRRGGRWTCLDGDQPAGQARAQGGGMRQPSPAGSRLMRRFGEPPDAKQRYVERPGAYAVILRRGEVLVVQWEGRLYLPGGGIDPHEGTLAALHRECLEETGWRIRVERRLGAFQRYLYASDIDLWLRKLCSIHLARPALRISGPIQPGHRAVWMPVDAAASQLAGEGERAYLHLFATPARPWRHVSRPLRKA